MHHELKMLYVCRPQVGNFLLVFKNNYPVCIAQRAMRLVALMCGVYVCMCVKPKNYRLHTYWSNTFAAHCSHSYCLFIHFI